MQKQASKRLPNKLPKDHYDTTDAKVDIWTTGIVYVWSEAFDPPVWIETLERITIRPGETGRQAFERLNQETLPKNMFIVFHNF